MCYKIGQKITLSFEGTITHDYGGAAVVCSKNLVFLLWANGTIDPCKRDDGIEYNAKSNELLALGKKYTVLPEFEDLGDTRLFRTANTKDGIFEITVEFGKQTKKQEEERTWTGKLIRLSQQ